MLTRDSFIGPWAGLPVAWTDHDSFDEETYRADVASCCQAGIPGVYTAGTSGEFYAADYDEWHAIARATVEECHARSTPAMIGCSSTYTRGAVRRATAAVALGADAVQVALPFWMETADDQVVPFFAEVAAAASDHPLSIYETSRAKKLLTLDQHRAVVEAVPAVQGIEEVHLFPTAVHAVAVRIAEENLFPVREPVEIRIGLPRSRSEEILLEVGVLFSGLHHPVPIVVVSVAVRVPQRITRKGIRGITKGRAAELGMLNFPGVRHSVMVGIL